MRGSVIVLALVVLLVGCTRRLGDLTVASNYNVVLSSYSPESGGYTQSKGSSCAPIILFIPLGFPNIEDAVDDALTKGGGNLMTDAVIRQTQWWFLYGQSCFRVEGKVWNIRMGSLDADSFKNYAATDLATKVSLSLADESMVNGDLVAFTRRQLVIREDPNREIRWIDRDDVADMEVRE